MRARPKLDAAAAYFGILPGFHDWRGAWREPDDEACIKVLAAMGIDASSEDAADVALRDAAAADAAQPGVAVLDANATRIDVEAGQAPSGSYEAELVLRGESGGEGSLPVS